MSVTVWSGALVGVQAQLVEVEVDLLRRLPAVSIVGLAAGAVRESAERVRSAIASCGFEFPRKRVVVNLAPADLRKDTAALDLPIALGILAADGEIPQAAVSKVLALGELSLGGRLRPVRGGLSLAALARSQGRELILPAASGPHASGLDGVTVRVAESLADVVAHLKGHVQLPVAVPPVVSTPSAVPDFAQVRGQRLARHAAEIAAAGGHHLSLSGPPGCGKTLIASRIAGILPPMSSAERLEVRQVYGVLGLPVPVGRPFRAPHHTVSGAGLLGDASLRPGEVSLAHGGVLFLDEAPEFARHVMEQLRTPLEQGVVRIRRAAGAITHPSRFQLVLASNPCPCGFRGTKRGCACTDSQVTRYQAKMSGPLADRIDLHVQLQPLAPAELMGPPGEASAAIRERVERATEFRSERGQLLPNRHASLQTRETCFHITDAARAAVVAAMDAGALSARGVDRTLRVARTIADLEGSGELHARHVHQALGFRPIACAA